MVKHRSGSKSRKLVIALRDNQTILVAVTLALSLLTGVSVLARRTSSGTQSESAAHQVTPASLAPGSPSKEYVYAGGRLIATEEPSGTNCTYVIAPPSQSFPASGGTGNVTVTVAAGCPWTAASNSAWITINSGTPGNGTGTVGYSVAVNSGAVRNGTMTIAGQTFNVSQTAAGCTYSILPANQSFGSSGGTGSVNVTAGPDAPGPLQLPIPLSQSLLEAAEQATAPSDTPSR